MMDKLTSILQLLSTLAVIIAFILVGIYPYIKERNKSLAIKSEKSGADKKQTATDTLMIQAKKLKVPLTKNVAAGLVQNAYNQTKTRRS